MKRLIVDMDDVIADATGQFISYYERDFGVRVTRDSLNHKPDGLGFPANHDAVKGYCYEQGFFRKMTPHENSQEILEQLNRKYALFIVSAAMEFPQSLIEKTEWLREHFAFLSWKQIVFCGSKIVIHGDYMIDDLPHNLETFNGEKLMFTAPHNMQYDQFRRVNNWKEVADILL